MLSKGVPVNPGELPTSPRAGCGSTQPERNQVPRERRVSHGKRTNPRRGVPVAKGDRRRPGRVGEQSYEPILPLKVANRRAPRKGAATIPTGGKGRTGRRIDGAPHTRDIELEKYVKWNSVDQLTGKGAGPASLT